MDVDIVCVGFGPATGGFLTTLSRELLNADGTPAVESRAMPGMPPQVLCYERADDIGFGVSGVVTRARGIRASFPGPRPGADPHGRAGHATRRSSTCSTPSAPAAARWRCALADACIRALQRLAAVRARRARTALDARLPAQDGGLVLSMGQFIQWVGAQVHGHRHGADLARHAGVARR